MSRLISLYSSVEIEAGEEQLEETETNQPEQIDQTKPTHHTKAFDEVKGLIKEAWL